MKKLFQIGLTIALLAVSLGSPARTDAQTEPPTYQLFLPLITIPGHLYLPLVVNIKPVTQNVPVGGEVVVIVYDPTNPNIVYLGSWQGGVYKSYDGGETWEQKNTGLPGMQIFNLAVDPTNPLVLYAGPYKNKLYKTTDGGETWSPASSGIRDQAIVYGIAIDPTNPNNLYISTRTPTTVFAPPWYGTVYRSTDGGTTWVDSLRNAGGTGEQDWVYSLAVNPSNPKMVFAAGHETGMYRSLDAGATWQSINTGISDLSSRSVVIDPSNNHVVYDGVWHRSGVFKSSDDGGHWAEQSSSCADTKIFHLAIDPSNPSTLFAASFSCAVLKSTDGGAHWKGVGLSGDFYAVVVNPRDSNFVLAGSATSGVWKSTDGGSTWRQIQWGFTNSGSAASLSFDPPPDGE